MAGSAFGRFLYPIVEGALVDDPDRRRRAVHEFDTWKNAYTGRTWTYRTDADPNVIGDATFLPDGRMIVLERDDFDGPRSVTKKLYVVDTRRTPVGGVLAKELLVDLLHIQNPKNIGTASSPGAYGVGNPFAFPMQSVETVVVLRDGRLLIANDNNYPGNSARVPGTPDDTEMIVLSLTGKTSNHGAPHDRVVVGHRGASGYRPEHTLAAYELAIRQCADYIEPDLVSTKDGVLVARHENEISGTTDVATRPEFASRRATKVIDGASTTGWFTEDLTLAELKSLRAIERIPDLRPANTAYNGLFAVPTLQEVLDLARTYRTCEGRPIGVYPETKHPSYFDSIGLSLEEPLVKTLHANGYDRKHSPVIIQSFEVGNLRDLNAMTDVRIAQLVSNSGRPWDFTAKGDPRTYADLVTPAGLDEIATYADGIGAQKDVLIPRGADGNLTTPSPVIADAHARRLVVHGWTVRAENNFLPPAFRSSAVPTARGDVEGEIRVFLEAGMDGFFTDQPDAGAAAVRPFER